MDTVTLAIVGRLRQIEVEILRARRFSQVLKERKVLDWKIREVCMTILKLNEFAILLQETQSMTFGSLLRVCNSELLKLSIVSYPIIAEAAKGNEQIAMYWKEIQGVEREREKEEAESLFDLTVPTTKSKC